MMKLVLMISALFAINHFATFDLSQVGQLGDYAVAVLVAMLVQPWVVEQLDS